MPEERSLKKSTRLASSIRLAAALVGSLPAILVAISVSTVAARGLMTEADVTGTWNGKLRTAGLELHIVLHLERTADGSYDGSLDSPDQGATGIAVGEIELNGNQLTVDIPMVQGKYEGTLDAAGKRIDGTWTQSGASLPLVFDLEGEDVKKTDDRKPQEPRPPFPYRAEEVLFQNRQAGIELAGTLTLPRGDGPFPALALVSGSGPQNRDEALLGHRPFFVLSDYLTRKGIAVLRFDDRGIGGSTGDFAEATTADFATDGSAAVDYLLSRPEIDNQRVGLGGHSEGGAVAPMVAAERRDIAFIVLLAGPGTTGEQILYDQGQLIGRANGLGEEALQKNLEQQKFVFGRVKSDVSNDELEKELRAYLTEQQKSLSEEERKTAEGAFEAQIRMVVTPWFRYFVSLDPELYLKKVKCPVLAINGEKDLQVPCQANLAGIERAVRAGGNSDVTIVALSGLNHLFQPCETGSPSEYATIEETFSPKAMETISSWILKKFK